MTLEEQIKEIKGCWEKEEPFCASACPFHLDIREFTQRMKRGGLNAAFRTFSNGVGFPELVAKLCPGYCQGACPRQETDAPVDLPRLEQAAVALAANTRPNSYNLPPKEGRFAIVGGGISGLACALRLCNKKYQVTVFEKSGSIGGQLLTLLPPKEALADIEKQFVYESYDLQLDHEVRDPAALLAEFDGVYVATGAGSFPQLLAGLGEEAVFPCAGPAPGLFLGGSISGCDIITALAQGLIAATALESWLKTGEPKGAAAHQPTCMRLDPIALTPQQPDTVDGPFNKEQAMAEAKRCLGCRCDACYRHCPLMGYFEKFPKRIQEEVHITIHPGTLDGNGTVATRLISTCSQCGLCREVCPQHIDMGAFFRLSHQAMRAKEAMPWAFHEFYLRDMEHAQGPASLWAAPVQEPGYLFFPGCQLGAAEPGYVTGLYELLRSYAPDCGLGLSCCGAPAIWAGDVPLQEQVFADIRAHWQAMGRPVLLLACPSCLSMFRQYLPELPARLVEGWLLEQGYQPPPGQGRQLTVFDPCALRQEPEERAAIRRLAERAGCTLAEPYYQGEIAQCCSWGGQIGLTNPPYEQWLAQQRAKEASTPYLTACVNCRDQLAAAGRETVHIFDLLLKDIPPRPPLAADINQRREARETLRRQLIEKYFPDLAGAGALEQPWQPQFTLEPGLKEKLGRERILLRDVQEVLDSYEREGRGALDPDSGHIFSYGPAGQATLWIEFGPAPEGGWRLYNAYCHRMKIESEDSRHEG